jgi:hypothetical protein
MLVSQPPASKLIALAGPATPRIATAAVARMAILNLLFCIVLTPDIYLLLSDSRPNLVNKRT